MRDNNLKEINLADLHIYSGSKIAIFVHWSKNDVISNHDKELINSLALEFDQVIVICNLNKSQSIEKNTKHNFGKNVKLINRVNSGYDFGAYQAGLAILKPLAISIDEILLMNNSVYRLHDSLNPLMTRVRNSGFDVTAITNSREKGLHLQSYFLHLKKTVLSKNEFWNWFEDLEVSDSRFVTIDKLEIPFAQIIKSFGLSSGALWDSDNLFNFYFSSSSSSLLLDFRSEWGWLVGYKEFLAGRMLNPTHYMWPHLLELGCPFLKKDLFRNNDLYLGIDNWENYVKSPQMILLIKENL
jgi:lipopolysaccharide biosynthesis protein